MERHNGKKKKKRCRDKETMPTEMPVPQSCMQIQEKEERTKREERVSREREYPWKCSAFCCDFWVLLFFLYIITDFSGISVFSSN